MENYQIDNLDRGILEALMANARTAYAELANDTDDALTSGCDGAAVALIERSLQHAARTLGMPVCLLVHGGGAPPLLPLLPTAEFRAALVLDGLATWATHSAAP